MIVLRSVWTRGLTSGEAITMRKRSAFTLIEILVTVAIISLLISITVPSLAAARRQSKNTKCKHNLHQISLAMQSYLQQHRDRFPFCKRVPSETGDMWTLPMALSREVGYQARKVTEDFRNEVFECPADRGALKATDPDFGKRFYDSYGTSYEWWKILNGLRVDFKSVTLEVGQPPNVVRQRVDLKTQWMINDFEGWHAKTPERPKSINILYADMHVGADKGE